MAIRASSDFNRLIIYQVYHSHILFSLAILNIQVILNPSSARRRERTQFSTHFTQRASPELSSFATSCFWMDKCTLPIWTLFFWMILRFKTIQAQEEVNNLNSVMARCVLCISQPANTAMTSLLHLIAHERTNTYKIVPKSWWVSLRTVTDCS